jgi:hypothetical protein
VRLQHFGLLGLRERAELVGGTVALLSQPGTAPVWSNCRSMKQEPIITNPPVLADDQPSCAKASALLEDRRHGRGGRGRMAAKPCSDFDLPKRRADGHIYRSSQRKPPPDQAHHPEIHVLVLTMHDNEVIHEVPRRDRLRPQQAAASGLVAAIRVLRQAISPAITRVVIQDYLRSEAAARHRLQRTHSRELKFTTHRRSHTNKEIAEMLCLSVKTVQAHRTSLMQKLDLHIGATSSNTPSEEDY